MSLEQELRRALTRKDPPGGFDDRVLSKIAAGETVRARIGARRSGRVALPIAASLMVAFGAMYYMQQQQRQVHDTHAHAEQTTRQVVLALQIASEKIAAAQAKVEEITRYEPTNDY
jgi:uncharacterized protein HemX